MPFESDSPVAELCARGMELTGSGAAALFAEAWNLAVTDIEKAIAAHYVARSQETMEQKLAWDERALHYALAADTERTAGFLPSLYLNIAKCHEDLGAVESALLNYRLAESSVYSLPDDGYGNLIRNGIANGIARIYSTAEQPK
jgi:hypothetical protein